MRYILITTLLITTLFACSNKLEERYLISVSEDIAISLTQGIDTSGSHLVLAFQSLNEIECSNSDFSYLLTENDQKIRLDIYDIFLEGDCDNSYDFVKTEIPIHIASDYQEFEISIKSSIFNSGNVELKNGIYKLNFDKIEGFALTNTQLNKITPNTAWGEIYFNSDNKDQHIEQLYKILESNKDTSFVPLNGNYGLFSYYNGSVIFPTENTTSFKFMLKYQDWDTFKQQMEDQLASISNITYKIQNDKAQTL